MDIPIDNSIIKFIYWLINTPGVGGITVMILGASLVLIFGWLLSWISAGDKAPEEDTYTYPTVALHHSGKNH